MLVNLNQVLKNAQKGGYAVGLFNTTDTDMLEGVITAAEQNNSPVIIGTAEILLPYGELSLIFPSVIERAKKASVPVVVHYDHGLTFDRCIEAIKLGASSVMFDGSALSYEENVRQTAEMVKIAHAFGVSVEGEIGHVGQASTNDGSVEDMYTTVEDAVDFVRKTNVDALAVAIGTAHGVYKQKPLLDLKRLQSIRDAVDVPLVLHGGSGLSDDDFKNTIKHGIAKVNIFTDICVAGVKAMSFACENNLDYLTARNTKVEYIRNETQKKMQLFGSVNRA